MKNKRLIIVCAILIGVCLVLLFRWHGSLQSNSLAALYNTNDAKTGLAKQPSAQLQPVNRLSAAAQNISTQMMAGATHPVEDLMEREYSHHFLFYGKVVDQNNAPVEGATARFNWATPDGNENYASAVSDGGGLFSLDQGKGYKLQVTVNKDGYYTPKSENLTTIAYGNELGNETFKADVANPVLFHLRKKETGAGLIHNLQLFGFRTNGPVQYLDLLEGKNSLTPPGDLAVQFTRGEKNAMGKYDWSVVMSAPDGGLYKTNEEFMFLAPAEGYQPSIEIHHDADDSDWVSQSKEKFYFTSRDGSIYGWAEATILPRYQGGAAIDLNYYINPSGSRNLEPSQQ